MKSRLKLASLRQKRLFDPKEAGKIIFEPKICGQIVNIFVVQKIMNNENFPCGG